LFGLIFIIYGSLIYNEIVVVPFCKFDEGAQDQRPVITIPLDRADNSNELTHPSQAKSKEERIEELNLKYGVVNEGNNSVDSSPLIIEEIKEGQAKKKL